jgi:hypothetical protein
MGIEGGDYKALEGDPLDTFDIGREEEKSTGELRVTDVNSNVWKENGYKLG